MENPLKGEATAAVAGADLRLVLDNDALVALEGVVGVSFLEVAAELLAYETAKRPPLLGTLRAILWAALRQHHPDRTVSDCGDMLVREGPKLSRVVIKTLIGALSTKETVEGEAVAPATEETSALEKTGTGTSS